MTMSVDSKLAEALDETFPASDPPANTVETGIRTGEISLAPSAPVSDNRQLRRFEVTVSGHTAFLAYQRAEDALTLIHTEVPTELRGRHIGETLVKAALNEARAGHLRVIAVCPFVKAYLRKHPLSP
jgi:uncharacterized protein